MHRGPAPHERRDGPGQQRPRQPFSFHAYARDGWSLEHIHAQNSEGLKKENQRRDWLEAHVKKIRATEWSAELAPAAEQVAAQIDAHLALLRGKTDDIGFQEILDKVFALFGAPGGSSTEEDMHGLGNLALLQRDFNSKLNNAVFALKRERILELDEAGAYILPCTRNVFLKYYTAAEDQQLSIWGPQDQEPYYEKLLAAIGPFLAAEVVAESEDVGMIEQHLKGYQSTFIELFDASGEGRPAITSIEIPIIQRDFAQGRPDDEASAIRERFLDAIVRACVTDAEMALDFVYGDVKAGVLRPLDGQQRLTTLFLLHWYVASRAGVLDPAAPWLRFSYATRPTARDFCESLAEHPYPGGPTRRRHGSPTNLGTSTPGGRTRRSRPCSSCSTPSTTASRPTPRTSPQSGHASRSDQTRADLVPLPARRRHGLRRRPVHQDELPREAADPLRGVQG